MSVSTCHFAGISRQRFGDWWDDNSGDSTNAYGGDTITVQYSSDGQPAVFTDSEGMLWSASELAGIGVNPNSANIQGDMDRVLASAAPDPSSGGGSWLSGLLGGAASVGGQGLAFLLANPNLVPEGQRGLIPGYRPNPIRATAPIAPPVPQSAGMSQTTMLALGGGALLAVILAVTLSRR